MRPNNRKKDELREIKVTKDFIIYPEGSVLIEFGNTKVVCNATIEERVPPFLRNSGSGWVTAEYSMMPRSTHTRLQRESQKGKLSGRTMEIQRLIGRSLRASVNLEKLGERQIILDCDVIQADGGTRTAAITGSYIALKMAINKLLENNLIKESPIISNIAAVSVGKVNGEIVLDLEYEEDYKADVDMNIIMNSKGEFVEIQGTGEETTFTETELLELLSLGKKGIKQLIEIQNEILGE